MAQNGGESKEKEQTSWYDVQLPLKKLSLRDQVRSSDTVQTIAAHIDEARNVHWRKSSQHKSKGPSGERKWMEQMTKAGTTADRIAAITLQLSKPTEVPFKLNLLGDLVSMTGHSGHYSRKVSDSLIELFTERVMPPERRLKAITTRNFHELPDGVKEREQVLFYWHTEDQVKGLFSKFVNVLKEGTNSSVESVKGYCIRSLYLLLSKVPEEEKAILTLLVNKLGDTMPKMATRAVHYLLQLLKENPTMRGAVVKELEAFMFRKNNSLRAQHYAVTVLSQIMLSRHDADLPQKLLEIYFACFSKAAQTQSLDNRLVNSLLTGIRRAFPFSQHKSSSMEKFYTSLFSIAALSAFPHRVAALTILHQVVEKGESNIRNRFYNSLYNLLQASPLNTLNMTSSKLALFFSLLYKSLRIDNDLARVLAFVHRLLQTCLQQKPSYVCGALFLVGEVFRSFPQLKAHVTAEGALVPASTSLRPGQRDDDVPEEEEEIKAPVDVQPDDESSDDIEGFAAVTGKKVTPARSKAAAKPPKREGPPVRANVIEVIPDDEMYDAGARNPCAAHAETELLWIIGQLCKHYHPSVATFASHISAATSISYEGDPLEDFTLHAFLDAFSFKNPKKKHMQTIRDGMDAALRRPTTRRQTLTHNPEAFADLPSNQVQIQDAFFYKYFKGRREKTLQLHQEDSDADSTEGHEEPSADAGDEGLEEDEEQEEAEEAKGAAEGEEGESDGLPAFMKKYLRYSYDDMSKDKAVLADIRQDKIGISDETVDAENMYRDAMHGRDEVEELHMSDEDLKIEDEEGSDSESEGPNFEAAVRAGEDASDAEDAEDLDDDLLAEMDKSMGVKPVAAVPAEGPEGSDGGDEDLDDDDMSMDLGGRGSGDEDSEEGAGFDSDSEEEAPRKKRRVLSQSKAYDVTRGTMDDFGKADASDFASLIESTAKIGTTKGDKWLQQKEDKWAGDRRRENQKGGKGGGKGGKGGGGGKSKGGGKGGKGGGKSKGGGKGGKGGGKKGGKRKR